MKYMEYWNGSTLVKVIDAEINLANHSFSNTFEAMNTTNHFVCDFS